MKFLLCLLMSNVFVPISFSLNVHEFSPDKIIMTQDNLAFMQLELTGDELKTIHSRRDILKHSKKILKTPSNLPNKIDLGMNGVPVLNQGPYPTCVTFATTAALDAAIGKGDYISQVCLLALGRELSKYNMFGSGWYGFYNQLMLNRIGEFGVISKEYELNEGCDGQHYYPRDGRTPQASLTIEDYISESSLDSPKTNSTNFPYLWSTILDTKDGYAEGYDITYVLIDVKKALARGERVVFGSALPALHIGRAGATGKHNTINDTWVLTEEILRDTYLHNMGGHAMIIIGYDDNAYAIDSQGKKHQGLLKIRNSWGENSGDHGNYYMTYEYFYTLVHDAFRIENL